MKLRLLRAPSSQYSTIGRLDVDGVFACFSLEDPVRDKKLYGQTAIPAGTYKVVLTHSPRFERVLPLIVDVPGYTGVRIHPGNTPADTDGCILVGKRRGQDVVLDSRAAFNELMPKLQAAKDLGQAIEIEIVPANTGEEWSV